MLGRSRTVVIGLLVVGVPLLGVVAAGGDDDDKKGKELPLTGKTPTELPRIPPPDPKAAMVAPGFAVRVAVADLTYPTSIEFDVKVAPDGLSLFVVDVGAMTDVPTALGPAPRPFPGTGVVWHIVPAK